MRNVDRTLLPVLLFVSIIFPVGSALADIPPTATDFTLTDVEGRSFSLSEFKGTTVALTFLAYRSVICRFQLETLVNVSRHFGDDLAVIAIGVGSDDFSIGGDTDETLRVLVSMYNFVGIMARDTENVTSLYGIRYIPTTVIIDPDGRIRQKHVGAVNADEEALLEELPDIIPEFQSTTILVIAMILAAITAKLLVRRPKKPHAEAYKIQYIAGKH